MDATRKVAHTLSQERRDARRAAEGLTTIWCALPPWFRHLRGFFVLAAQLLVAAIAGLILAERKADNESQFRWAMILALVGLFAALIGSLPQLHRGLDAFLLGRGRTCEYRSKYRSVALEGTGEARLTGARFPVNATAGRLGPR